MKTNRRKSQGTAALAVILIGAAALGLWQYLTVRPLERPEQRVLFYQDSMHPWIKSDQPGKCTICLMDLTPIHQGEQGFAPSSGTVVLSSNSVTVMNVQTEETKKRTLHRMLRVSGNLEADNTRKTILAAPAPGRIDNVRVESAGVDVKQGQVLATFYSPELTFQTRRYIFRDRLTEGQQGGMNMAGNPVGSSRHAPTFGTSKTQPLPANERAEADPFYNDLLATLSGTVVERNVFNGQYVAEGDRMFTIVDLSLLWFRFDVYEHQLSWLETGQRLNISVPSLPGREFPAVITVIEPTLNETTRTIKVRADVANPLDGPQNSLRRPLRLGMYAEGWLNAEVPDVVAVPRTAVLFPGGRAYAYVDKGGGAFAMRRVQLGRQGDDYWEVLGGLEEGERVVTSGNVLIDAQAQFNHGGEPEEMAEHAAGSSEAPACHEAEKESACCAAGLTDAQRKVAAEFLALADKLSSVLAADSVEHAKHHSTGLRISTEALAREFAKHPLEATAQKLHEHASWGAIADLTAARKAFLPFSSLVVEFVQSLRASDKEFASAKVFHCPMAPKPGHWYQAKGPLRNPYFGAQMLTCGEEVRAKPLTETIHSLATVPSGHLETAGPDGAPVVEADSQTNVPADAPLAKPMDHSHLAPAPTQSAAPASVHPASEAGAAALRQASADARMAAMSVRSRATASQKNLPSPSDGTSPQTLEAFVRAVDGISQALAADDLLRYHQEVAALPAVLAAMQKAFPSPHRWNVLLQRLSLITEGSPPKTLELARKRFLPFSTNATELIRQLRQESKALSGLKIYKCPMAPAPGTWVQAQPPLRNPFFGAKMLTCGEEVPL